MKRLIGITGKARSGKDTVATLINKHMVYFEIMSFAEPIKQMLKIGLNLTDEQLYGDKKETFDYAYNCSARHMMQTLGTEWGRNLIHPDIWVIALDKMIQEFTIIPDVRFQNEADYVRERGVLIHVYGNRGGIAGNHISEQDIAPNENDYTIQNIGSIDELEKQVIKFVQWYVNRCQCKDDEGKPLNQCDECPR